MNEQYNIHEVLRRATILCATRDGANKKGPFTEIEDSFDGGVLYGIREVLAVLLDCYPEDITFHFKGEKLSLRVKGIEVDHFI